MQRQRELGATLLVAGTCIGAGILALPITLAKIGLIPSACIMLLTWILIYYTSLFSVELNLQANTSEDISYAAKRFGGKTAYIATLVSLKTFSYTLLAAFLYGFSSIVSEILAKVTACRYLENIGITALCGHHAILAFCSIVCIILLLLPIRTLDYLNRTLFTSLIVCFAIITIYMVSLINFASLPLFAKDLDNISTWKMPILVVFYSFGFQIMFHTLTSYCKRDHIVLRKAFFFGSLIPVFAYIIWTSSTLSVLYARNPHFYYQMTNGDVSLGAFIQELSLIVQLQSMQVMIWLISLLAILTSIIGVGSGLHYSVNSMLKYMIFSRQAQQSSILNSIISSTVVIFPAFLIVLLTKDAFLKILGFAGMLSSIVGILLPIYLCHKGRFSKYCYPALENRVLIAISLAFGFLIIFCEIL